MVKRALDIVSALTGLAVLTPLLLVVAAAVLLKSGRPVFFLQERAGLHGRAFRIIKFRSMTRDAEQRIQGQYIAADNPYVTPISRFLRKTSLDELPELVNVLKGDMSLVGPRPTLPEQVAAYDVFQRRRLEVRPGIKGWAQVNGRNSISWTERIKLDVWYVDHWTPWLDICILLMTIGQVLRQRGVEDMPPSCEIALQLARSGARLVAADADESLVCLRRPRTDSQVCNGMSAAALQAARGPLSRGTCVKQHERMLFGNGE